MSRVTWVGAMQLQESLYKEGKSVSPGSVSTEAEVSMGENVKMLQYWFEDEGRGCKARNAVGL